LLTILLARCRPTSCRPPSSSYSVVFP
jgi:hypothetical protein